MDTLRAFPFVCLLVLNGPVGAAESGRVVVRPRDHGGALLNPGMGWVFHHYDNSVNGYGPVHGPGYDGSHFPGLNVVYLRLAWSYLEPEEGVFNWSTVDTVAQRYLRRGCQVAFRFTCFESGARFATPEWVRQAGAKGTWWRYGKGVAEETDPRACWEPDYDDPVFLAKLDAFLGAAGERYDGDPRVAFVDVGSIGIWGEGNPVSRTYPRSMYRTHVDLHVKHFPRTLLAAMDDWGPTSEELDFHSTGERPLTFVLRVPEEFRGRELFVKAGMWVPGEGGRGLPEGRLLPAFSEPDRRVLLGHVTADAAGVLRFRPSESGGTANGDPDFGLRPGGLLRRGRWELQCRLNVRRPLPDGVRPFCHVGCTEKDIVHNAGTGRAGEHMALYAKTLGCTVRDDSIMYKEGITYRSDWLAREFWPDRPVIIESGHYSANDWGDGSTYVEAMEDYHASFVSIHGNPFTILADHAETIAAMNRRMGYRLQLVEASWPEAVVTDDELDVHMTWRNAGVAPCYGGGFPCLTLKCPDGAIAAVLSDESLNVKDMPVGAPGEAVGRESRRRLLLPVKLAPGTFGVFVSVGTRDGTPRLALPLEGDDGERRYRLGDVRVTLNGEYVLEHGAAEARAGQTVVPVTFRVLKPLPDGVRPFCHLEVSGRIAAGLGCRLDGKALPDLRRPGSHAGCYVLDVPETLRGGTYAVKAGLWVFEGRRIVPGNGEADLRVTLGTLRVGDDGALTYGLAE